MQIVSDLILSLTDYNLIMRFVRLIQSVIFGTPVMWKKKQCYIIIYAKKSSLWSRGAASNISRAYIENIYTDRCDRESHIVCALRKLHLCVIRYSTPPTYGYSAFRSWFRIYTHFHSVFILCVAALGLLLGGATLLPLSFFAFIYLYITTSAVAERQQQQPPSRSRTQMYTFAYIIQYERSPVTACERRIMSQTQYKRKIYVNTSSSSSSVSCNILSI